MAASFRKKASFKPLYFTDSDENEDPTQSSQIRDTNVNSGDALSMKNSQTSKKNFTCPESSTFDEVAMLKKGTFSESSERGVDGLKKHSVVSNRDGRVKDDAGKKPTFKGKRKGHHTACTEKNLCETVAHQKQKLPWKTGDSVHVKKNFFKVESGKITKVQNSKRTVTNENRETCSKTSFTMQKKKTSKKILLRPLCSSNRSKCVSENKFINAPASKHLLEVVNPGQDTKDKFSHNISDMEETSDSDDHQWPQRLLSEKRNRFSGKSVIQDSSKGYISILSCWEEAVSLSEESLTRKRKALECAEEILHGAESLLKLESKILDDAIRKRLESPLPGSDTVYHKMLEASLNFKKESVSLSEEMLPFKKRTVEFAKENVQQAEALLKLQSKFLKDARIKYHH